MSILANSSQLDQRPSVPAESAPAAVEAAPVIQTDGLSVRLGGVAALTGVSLAIQTGEFVLVSGPSGSGKSTLARALAGLLQGQPGVTLSGAITVAARHAGLVLALALVAPLLTGSLERAGERALLGGTREILDADVPIRKKVMS